MNKDQLPCVFCGVDTPKSIKETPICFDCIEEMTEIRDCEMKKKVDKTINGIINKVQEFTGIQDITIKTRKREICEARQIAHYLCKKHTRNSLAVIGYEIGKKDHATVLHSSKTVKNLLSDKLFREKYFELINYYE